MILYLMRHGQTDWNANERVQGWSDIVLNQKGIEQAKSATNFLKDKGIETIYSSDLKRAKKTAEIIGAELDLPIHFTKKIREINFGDAESTKKTDLSAKFPYVYQAFNDVKNAERYDVKYPNGETIGEVQQRFIKFLNRLAADKRGTVLLVTHGMLIRIFTETYFKKTFRLDNGSILKIIYDDKSKKFRSPKVVF